MSCRSRNLLCPPVAVLMIAGVLGGCKVVEDYTPVQTFRAIVPDLSPPRGTPLRIEIRRTLVLRVEGEEPREEQRTARLVLVALPGAPQPSVTVREWESDWTAPGAATVPFRVAIREGKPVFPDGCDPVLRAMLAEEAARLARAGEDDPLTPPGPVRAGTGWPRDVREVLAHPIAAPFVDLPFDEVRSSAYAQASGIVIEPNRVRWAIGLHGRVTPSTCPAALWRAAGLPDAQMVEGLRMDLRARQVGDVDPEERGGHYDREEFVRATARWSAGGRATTATLTETRRRRPD